MKSRSILQKAALTVSLLLFAACGVRSGIAALHNRQAMRQFSPDPMDSYQYDLRIPLHKMDLSELEPFAWTDNLMQNNVTSVELDFDLSYYAEPDGAAPAFTIPAGTAVSLWARGDGDAPGLSYYGFGALNTYEAEWKYGLPFAAQGGAPPEDQPYYYVRAADLNRVWQLYCDALSDFQHAEQTRSRVK